jgi:hypothetical protein
VPRLDKLRGTRLIAQHPAELPHGRREHVLTHYGVGPDRCQQRVFGHESARLGHQAGEDGKGFRGQTDHLGTTPQAFVPEVELKRAKHETLWRWHMSPFPRPPSHCSWAGIGQFSPFFQEFFTVFSGLWPGFDVMLPP